MNLLLLLSALLSALSGAGVAARPAGAAQAVASRSATVAAVRTVRGETLRPAAALPTRAAVAEAAALPRVILAPIALWASRRRE